MKDIPKRDAKSKKPRHSSKRGISLPEETKPHLEFETRLPERPAVFECPHQPCLFEGTKSALERHLYVSHNKDVSSTSLDNEDQEEISPSTQSHHNQSKLGDARPSPDMNVALSSQCKMPSKRVLQDEQAGSNDISYRSDELSMSMNDSRPRTSTELVDTTVELGSFERSEDSDVDSGESSVSSDSRHMTPESEARLRYLYAKHEAIVNLMRDVYAIFDHSWHANPKTCPTAPHGSSSCNASGPSPHSSASNTLPSIAIQKGKGKRKHRDREDSPTDGEDDKRKRKPSSLTSTSGQSPRYACPFNKHYPWKYGPNDRTGQTYRTCHRPGFESIARLK